LFRRRATLSQEKRKEEGKGEANEENFKKYVTTSSRHRTRMRRQGDEKEIITGNEDRCDGWKAGGGGRN